MASLTFTTGDRTGETIEIDKNEISIGRSDQNDIPLDEAAVSGRHCSVVRDGNKLFLRDKGSTNGTRLNGKNVTEARMKPGDVISVGPVEIMVSGNDIEVEPEYITKANASPTVIIAPPHTIAGGPPPSPVFQTKRDNRLIVIAVVLVCLIVVAVAMVFFLKQLLK